MINRTIVPVYKLEATTSQVSFKTFTTQSEIIDCAGSIDNGFAIIWLFSEIKTLSIKNGQLSGDLSSFDLIKYLVKARFFNEEKEWHIWRSGDVLKGRFRDDTDNSGEVYRFVKAELPLKAVITDPLSKMSFKGNMIKLITRNYVDYQNYQAGYYDMRFVNFKN